MDKTQLLNQAIEVAMTAHKGQLDRYGAPYILHPLRVMNYGKTLDEKIVGILHDVIEDCPDYSLKYFQEKGYPENILFALDCVTKKSPDEDYDKFVARTAKSPLAIAVKLNDLRDKMDIRRVTIPLTEKDLKRLNKYIRAYQFLISK